MVVQIRTANSVGKSKDCGSEKCIIFIKLKNKSH